MANRSRRASARQLATKQREIAVSEFFLKNRHLLGFDTPQKALLTAIKEAVDNALDACEDAGYLPEIRVEVEALEGQVCRIAVEDNGPGIVEEQIAKIFGKLLYGSKFHKLAQSRGQQGLGISAAGMYAQLTTGKPVKIRTHTGSRRPAQELMVSMDTNRNRPDLHRKREVEWDVSHGTRVEMELEAQYQRGVHSVDMYLKQCAIANPHVTIHFRNPHGDEVTYERNVRRKPPRPVEIKPHPHGVELGRLIAMLHESEAKHLGRFLREEFSQVGGRTAARILKEAGKGLTNRSYTRRIAHQQASALHAAIEATPVRAPRTDCLVPIGEEQMLRGLQKEVEADFYVASTRPPAVYRGNPFRVEVALAYGRPGGVGLEVVDGGRIQRVEERPVHEDLVAHADEPVRLLRFANRVPLLYQQSACAITQAVQQVGWKGYGLTHPRGGLPIGPMVLMVHLASVWVPFTSESKEAVAAYPEIAKEIRLALQRCGRQLATHIRKERSLKREYGRRVEIERYLPHVGAALQTILGLEDTERDALESGLDDTLHRRRSVR